jgi:hypothetical protein
MDTPSAPNYRGYRFPHEIIAHCVWLYFRFGLSFRDIQEMMPERSVEVSHEAIRIWCLTFGAEYARKVRRRGAVLGTSGISMKCSTTKPIARSALTAEALSAYDGLLWLIRNTKFNNFVRQHTITFSHFTQESCGNECTRSPDWSARHPIHP